MCTIIKIITKKLAWFNKNLYLCSVFFMVLDLRLTEEGRREMAFFFCVFSYFRLQLCNFRYKQNYQA